MAVSLSPRRVGLLLAVTLSLPGTGSAAARDFCPDRPGIDTPACTVEPGRLSAEVSLGDWTHDANAQSLDDQLVLGDLALRYGVADHAEVRLGWTAYGHTRSRDRANGAVTTSVGTGDLTLGIKRNLVNPDGKGFSLALLPSVTLPTGGQAIGAGDWGAGLQMPIGYAPGGAVSLMLTPELDAAPDADRSGRHLAWGVAGGVGIAATSQINLAVEAQLMRDDDPAGATTSALAGLAAGLMLGDNAQIDLGSELGLNHNAPDRRIYVGYARRF